jgi:hypothetical protein
MVIILLYLGMIQNEYEKSIFGFLNEAGNVIDIKGLGTAVLTTAEDWTRTVRYVGYRIKTLADENTANLCQDYVGKHRRTIKFQVHDKQGGQSNIFSKNVEVRSATFMFTDRSAVATDAAASTSLGMPGTFDAELAKNFTMSTQGV